MHKSRANSNANRERRARAAHKQRPVPLETQREIAADNRARRLAIWAAQGPEYLHPTYDATYKPSGPRRSPLRFLEEILSPLEFLRLLLTFKPRKAA